MYHGYSTMTHTVGTAMGSVWAEAGTIAAANAGRKYLRIDNNSGSAVWMKYGGSAAANQGIRLNGAGSASCYLELTWGQENLYAGYVTAVVGTGGSVNLLVNEGT